VPDKVEKVDEKSEEGKKESSASKESFTNSQKKNTSMFTLADRSSYVNISPEIYIFK